jgi:predicted transcriptional regulator
MRQEIRVASAKQLVQEVLDSLPDDCSLEDVQYELYVRQKVAEGERAADAGETVPHQDVIREARARLSRL